jgi:hypothetical protein
VLLNIHQVKLELPVPSEIIPILPSTTQNISNVPHTSETYSKNGANATQSFYVCGLDTLQQKHSTLAFKETSPRVKDLTAVQHDMLICTATSRRSRPHLVEWIEYHLLLGVNHFVLYDTTIPATLGGVGSDRTAQRTPTYHSATPSAEASLSNVIADYIAKGVVTVIPWPYNNCVRGMASGRMAADFKVPGTIAHNAALASCYSRFRDSSRWIAHVDDDEFLVSSFVKK